MAQTDSLQKDAVAVDTHGSTFASCVGSRSARTTRLELRVRNSRQCSFYPPPPNAAGLVETRVGLINAVNELRKQLQASVTIGLPHLEPFQTELCYLLYPIGGHYMRHLDIPTTNCGWELNGRGASDGGSFTGGQTRRVVSFILYLNREWDKTDGGELRIFPAGERGDGSVHSQQAGHIHDILPEGGTLVLIMSGEVEHLVRETRAARQCVVGWFREYRERSVPDLDAMSLCSRTTI
eukprot:CAMPEP_0119314976 /NCGR_PEP_ID=MMETSP1333-20130426/34132_1 /TAXON_ID=418940 /ORGANISM="Scyphosphaera apsteinii, Strain RCC1455" /LENGTH=236 /DNA_ID=CAMNT_0007320185 /DNA_START=190 /DNA_END=900 /DNA_ORIENTATION=-